MAEAIIEGKAAYAEANGEDAEEVSVNDEMVAAMTTEVKEEAAAATDADVAKLVEEKAAPKAAAKTETKTEEKAAPKAKAPAKKAAAKTTSDKKGDDLTKIVGVGKVYQGKLNDEGFYTFNDVANMTAEQIQVMEDKYSFKGDFKDAVASAKELAGA
jgi:predicted flap endonuclease-1-like 5' DNA nuclease